MHIINVRTTRIPKLMEVSAIVSASWKCLTDLVLRPPFPADLAWNRWEKVTNYLHFLDKLKVREITEHKVI